MTKVSSSFRSERDPQSTRPFDVGDSVLVLDPDGRPRFERPGTVLSISERHRVAFVDSGAGRQLTDLASLRPAA